MSSVEREVKNIGAFLPGYHGSEARLQQEQPEATLWFASSKFAKMAAERLHGFEFDAEKHVRLRASLVGEGMPGGEARRSVGDTGGHAAMQHAAMQDTMPNEGQQLPVQNQVQMHDAHGAGNKQQMMAAPTGAYFYAPAMVMPNVGSMSGGMVSNMSGGMVSNMSGGMVSNMSGGIVPGNHQGNPPCNTLFIGNLTVAATEEELEDVFWYVVRICLLVVVGKRRHSGCCLGSNQVLRLSQFEWASLHISPFLSH